MLALVPLVLSVGSCQRGVADEPGTLISLDARTGRELWTALPDDAFFYSPGIAGDVIYVEGTSSCKGHDPAVQYAYDARTGKQLWQGAASRLEPCGHYRRRQSSRRTVVIRGSRVLGLEPETGRTRWTVQIGPRGDVVDAGDIALVTKRDHSPIGRSGVEILALDKGTGQQLWSKRLPGDAGVPPVANNTISLVDAGSTHADSEGGVIAFDTRTGSERWRRGPRFPARGSAVPPFIDFSPSGFAPAVVGDVLAVEENEGLSRAVAGLDAASGSYLWRVEGAGLYGADGGLVLIGPPSSWYPGRARPSLVALDARTGVLRSEIHEFYEGVSMVGFGEGVVVLGPAHDSPSRELIGIDALTGQRLWRYVLPDRVRHGIARPAISHGRVYIAALGQNPEREVD